MIKDTCPCGACITIEYKYASNESILHKDWLEAHRVCRVKEPFESPSPKATCGDCGHPLQEVRPGKHQCDYCEIANELQQWREAYHNRCDAQLDTFRKQGMQEAAEHCIKGAKSYSGNTAAAIVNTLRRDFPPGEE